MSTLIQRTVIMITGEATQTRVAAIVTSRRDASSACFGRRGVRCAVQKAGARTGGAISKAAAEVAEPRILTCPYATNALSPRPTGRRGIRHSGAHTGGDIAV